jgi:hypothetical protein
MLKLPHCFTRGFCKKSDEKQSNLVSFESPKNGQIFVKSIWQETQTHSLSPFFPLSPNHCIISPHQCHNTQYLCLYRESISKAFSLKRKGKTSKKRKMGKREYW